MRFLTSSLDKHHLLKWVFQESRRFQRNPFKAYCIIIILSSINIITDSSSNLHKRYNCMKFQHEGYTIQLTSRIFRRIFCAHKIKNGVNNAKPSEKSILWVLMLHLNSMGEIKCTDKAYSSKWLRIPGNCIGRSPESIECTALMLKYWLLLQYSTR